MLVLLWRCTRTPRFPVRNFLWQHGQRFLERSSSEWLRRVALKRRKFLCGLMAAASDDGQRCSGSRRASLYGPSGWNTCWVWGHFSAYFGVSCTIVQPEIANWRSRGSARCFGVSSTTAQPEMQQNETKIRLHIQLCNTLKVRGTAWLGLNELGYATHA